MTQRGPLVSIILTSYNQGRWLRDAIGSVLEQTYPHWELIAIDNGSTDDSGAILEAYRGDSRITIVRHSENRPHTQISNQGVRMAAGDYVSFLYSDDYYLPQKLEKQVAAFEHLSRDYGVVYSACYRLHSDGELHLLPCGRHVGNVLERLLIEREFFMPVAPLVRRECLVRHPFNETIFMEGEGIFTRLAMTYLFHPLPEPLAVMRDHPDNMGKEIANNLHRNVIWYEDLFRRPEFPAALRPLRARIIGETYRLAGWQTIRRTRDYGQGRAWLRDAISIHPPLKRDPRVLVGLAVTALPGSLAGRCIDVMDFVFGSPPPPVAKASTPVRGVAPAQSGDH